MFENLVVIETLKSKLNQGKDPRLFFYRDSHGNEVDLIIQNGRVDNTYNIGGNNEWANIDIVKLIL